MENPKQFSHEEKSDFFSEQKKWNAWHKGIPEAPLPKLTVEGLYRQQKLLHQASATLHLHG